MAALRALRTWSGLTYRQVQGKAAALGDVLPASTLATALARATLPRAEFVAALARACGLGDDEVRQWVKVRNEVALGAVTTAPGTGAPQPMRPSPEPGEATTEAGVAQPRRRALVTALVALCLAAALTGVYLVTGSAPPESDAGTAFVPIPGLPLTAVGSWGLLHPAAAPDRCVTEGRDRTGAYGEAVAALGACTQVLPRTYLRPARRDLIHIEWHHPEHGIGCLTVLEHGEARDLLEPWGNCEAGDQQLFRLDPVDGGRYRLRPVHSDQCVGLRGERIEDGAELRHGPCTGRADQEFVVELRSPPT